MRRTGSWRGGADGAAGTTCGRPAGIPFFGGGVRAGFGPPPPSIIGGGPPGPPNIFGPEPALPPSPPPPPPPPEMTSGPPPTRPPPPCGPTRTDRLRARRFCRRK